MRTTRILAIVAILGIAVSFCASANITVRLDAGFDFTNGTITVSGAQSEPSLTVYGFDGAINAPVGQKTGDTVIWDLANLIPGGLYSYMIVDGGDTANPAYGEFVAANWATNDWFVADASKGDGQRAVGGSWATEEPSIKNDVYVIEDDSVFNVTDPTKGQGRVTRVDVKVTFETLVEDEVDVPADGVLSGFTATTEGWKALTAGETATEWVLLTGAISPTAGRTYIIRAEIEFISANTKHVRYLVSNDGGTTFYPLFNGTAQWIALANSTGASLAKVRFQGSGLLANFNAKVTDKALAKVGDQAYDTMAGALAAAGTEGANPIKLLTNATVDPTKAGKYEILADNYHYVSGGKVFSGDRTITIDDPEKPPVVRPNDQEMEKVTTPEGAVYKNYASLRAFLERNKVEGYTKDDANATSIAAALAEIPADANGLALWQDYALGIDKTVSVAPVTIPTGDTDEGNITLSIPAIDPSKYSGDYDITYKVEDGTAEYTPQAIKIPLGTGTYSIKAVFTPKH